jgi:hypothetical protein
MLHLEANPLLSIYDPRDFARSIAAVEPEPEPEPEPAP